MSSKLSVNVNDPNASNTPDEPADAEPIVIPDTGGNTILDTKNIGDNGVSMVLPIVGAVVLAVIIVVTIITAAIRRRKVNKFSVHTSRHLVAKVASLSVVLLLGLFAIANLNGDSGSVSALLFGGDSNTKASIQDNVNALSITTSDIVIDLDLENDKVFGVGESVVSVDTATTAGYTLMAYVDSNSTDLKNETNTSSSSAISMLETTYSQALTDNTWGMAINEPSSEEDVLFRGLPTTEKEIMTLKATSEATVAGDESTFYYGAYITPDLDYGTYGGVTISYVALANVDTDVVTVRYSSVEDGTASAIYGARSRIAYLYNGCSTEYLGETRIVKTDNLDNNGIMTTYYVPSFNYEDFKYMVFDGADYLRVELTYGFEDDTYAMVYNDSVPGENSYFTSYGSGDLWSYDGETTTVSFVVASNTIGLDVISRNGLQLNNYGYYARITPVYVTRPLDAEVTEYENCHIAKTDNIDDSGNKVKNFDSTDQYINGLILIPGAERMIVDIKYGFANGNTYFAVAKGIMSYADTDGGYYFRDSSSYSGDNSFHLGGGAASIIIELYGNTEDYDGAYGFYAQGYPIYSEERENTVPILVYDAFRKSGSYFSSDSLEWRYYPNGVYNPDGSFREIMENFLGEEAVIEYIGNNFEALRGQTLDLEQVWYIQ